METSIIDASKSNYHAVYNKSTGKVVNVVNSGHEAMTISFESNGTLQGTYCGEAINQAFNEGKTIIRNESGVMEIQITQPLTRADYEAKPPFDDEYSGPRFKYGMKNRPFGIATAPKGAILMSYKENDKEAGSRHGTIEYPFQLTKDEVYNFELVDFSAIKQQAIDARIIRNNFVEELEKRGFILEVSNSERMLAVLPTAQNGFIQAGFNEDAVFSAGKQGYSLFLNTDKLNNPIELDYKTPADIDIQRSLKWIDKELAKTIVPEIDHKNDPEAALRELWTKQGVSPEKQEALLADVTAKAQPGAKVGPFTIPQEIPSINPSTTTQTGGHTMENRDNKDKVSTTTEYKITGAKLAEKLEKLELSQTKKASYLDTRIALIATMPDVIEKTIKGKSVTVTKAQELAGYARTEAINAMSKGEYVHNMNTMREINKKRTGEPLGAEDQERYTKARDSNARLSKNADHPDKKAEFANQFKKAMYFNCTPEGLEESKRVNAVKLENTKAMLVEVKKIPDYEFSIKIKEQRNLPNLTYDEKFTKELTAAVAAKIAPAPEVKKSRSRK